MKPDHVTTGINLPPFSFDHQTLQVETTFDRTISKPEVSEMTKTGTKKNNHSIYFMVTDAIG